MQSCLSYLGTSGGQALNQTLSFGCHQGWGRYAHGPWTVLFLAPGKPSPNPVCSSSSEYFSPKPALHTFYDGLRSHVNKLRIQMWSGNVRGASIQKNWWRTCFVHVLGFGCWQLKWELCLPLFCSTKQMGLISSMDGCWSEVFAFNMLLLLFLMLTPDTLWQRSCEKQPGLVASLPHFYIPGCNF